MSVHVWDLVLKARLPSGTEKLVLLCLANYANDDGGSIYPSVALLAEVSCLSERAVQTTLRKLVDAGILRTLTDGRGGRGRSTEYAINLAEVRKLIPNAARPAPIEAPAKGAACAEKGAVDRAKPRSSCTRPVNNRHDPGVRARPPKAEALRIVAGTDRRPRDERPTGPRTLSPEIEAMLARCRAHLTAAQPALRPAKPHHTMTHRQAA